MDLPEARRQSLPTPQVTGHRRLFNMFNIVLGLRLDPVLEKKLIAMAQRQGRTKSDVAREAIRRYLDAELLPPVARRQSLLVAGDRAEREATEFVEQATDFTDEP